MHPTSLAIRTSPLLLYINDLLKTIVRSFVHIYAEVTNIYGSISKRLDEQNWHLIVFPAVTLQWGKYWLVTFNDLKIKLVTYHHRLQDGELS